MHKVLFSAFVISICLPSVLQAKTFVMRELIPLEDRNSCTPSKKTKFVPIYTQIEPSTGKSRLPTGPAPVEKQVYITTQTDPFTDYLYYSDSKGNKLPHFRNKFGKTVKGGTIYIGPRAHSLKKLDKDFVEFNPEYKEIKIPKKFDEGKVKHVYETLEQRFPQDPKDYQLIRRLKRVPVPNKPDKYIFKAEFLEVFRYGNNYKTTITSKNYSCRYDSDENGEKISHSYLSETTEPFSSLETLDHQYCELHPEMRSLKALGLL